jgi:hypothetical protein
MIKVTDLEVGKIYYISGSKDCLLVLGGKFKKDRPFKDFYCITWLSVETGSIHEDPYEQNNMVYVAEVFG